MKVKDLVRQLRDYPPNWGVLVLGATGEVGDMYQISSSTTENKVILCAHMEEAYEAEESNYE